MRLLVIAGCLSSVAAFTRPALTGTRSRSPRRHYAPILGEESPDSETDWVAAMESLRARQQAAQATGQDSDTANAMDSTPPPPGSDAAAPEASADSAAGGFRFDQPMPDVAPQTSADPSEGGFRFDRSRASSDRSSGGDEGMIAGLDTRDQEFVRRAYLIGGRVLTLTTLATLVFYIYIGLSGGITDGFDRFDAPIEDIRETIAREGAEAFQPDVSALLPPDRYTSMTGIPPELR